MIRFILLSLLLLFPFMIKGQEGIDLGPKRLVLSIGIDVFDDAQWSPLKFSAKDALAIDKFFTIDTNFKADWSHTLYTNKEKGLRVTAQDINDAFSLLRKEIRSEKDIVIIYVSTHGSVFENPDTGKQGRYLITSDTAFNEVDKKGLNFDKMMSLIQSLPANNKIFILDSCFSGVGKSQFSEATKIAFASYKGNLHFEDLENVGESEFFLFSSAGSEPSQENVELGHSVYTNFLLEGFRRDLNEDGAVTVLEAHNYAQEQTRIFTKNAQNPTAKIAFSGHNPIFVYGKKSEKDSDSYIFNRWSSNENLEVIIDGENKGQLGKGISLKSGKRRVTFLNPINKMVVADQVVRFTEGKEYSASSILLIPKYPHTFDLHISTFAFLNSEVNQKFTPDNPIGFGFTYTYQELWKTFDMGLTFESYQTKGEKGQIEGSNTMKQDREMIVLNPTLGGRENFSFLTTGDGRITSNFSWSGGPSFMVMNLKRSYFNSASSSPIETIDQGNKLFFGLSGSASLNMEIPSVNLRAGIKGTVSVYQNPFDKGDGFLLSVSPLIYVGIHW